MANCLGISLPFNYASLIERVVYWVKPKKSFIKINMNGSISRNTFGYGGNIIYFQGNIIYSFTSPLVACYAPIVELKVVSLALDWCLGNGFSKIWLDIDALFLVHLINFNNGGSDDPFYFLNDVTNIITKLVFKISHIYREGNTCADHLASLGASLEPVIYFSSSELSSSLRGLINVDKNGLPYISFH